MTFLSMDIDRRVDIGPNVYVAAISWCGIVYNKMYEAEPTARDLVYLVKEFDEQLRKRLGNKG